MPAGSSTLWFTIALIAIVVVRFLARELRERKIPLNRLWFVPAFLAAISAYLFYTTLQADEGLLAELMIGTVAGLVVGTGVGYAVDRSTALRLSPEGSAIIVRGSYITVAIWIGALLLRLLGRFVVSQVSMHSLGMTMLLNTSFVCVIAAAAVMVRFRWSQRAKALQTGLPAFESATVK